MEIRHLVALSAVAREGSFRGAADQLGYVQSAISQQISQLEHLVGCRLLERSRGMRGCSPTPAGQILLAHVDQIVARYHAAQADMAAFEHAEDAALRVGLVGSVATRLLPALIRRVGATAPAIRLAPVEARGDAELAALVEQGTIDAALGVTPGDPGPFETYELGSEPLVLVVQADSPLARGSQPPTVEEIAGLPLIEVSSARSETTAAAWLLALGATPRVVNVADSEAMAQALVAAGLGVALLPRFAVNEDDRRTAVVLLGESAPARRLAVYWHGERHPVPALRDFCAVASAVAKDLAGAAPPPPTPVELPLPRVA